jgi:hypothetical protein
MTINSELFRVHFKKLQSKAIQAIYSTFLLNA